MIEEFFVHLMASLTEHALPHIRPGWVALKLVRRDHDARVAFAAILRIRTHDQKYLLVRNPLRQESYSPFGGVYKYHLAAKELLDKVEFRPQVVTADMRSDLRGFLPRKHVLAISKWFQARSNRESYTECLRRELREELSEAGVASRTRCPDDLQFRNIWTVWEGPEPVKGESYTQLRIFDVCEVSSESPSANEFVERLINAADQQAKRKNTGTLLLVTEAEIRKGRAQSGEVIGHPAGYLFTKRRLRPDSPSFSTLQPH